MISLLEAVATEIDSGEVVDDSAGCSVTTSLVGATLEEPSPLPGWVVVPAGPLPGWVVVGGG